MNKHFYLIDATAFCYRAFYALKGLSTSTGQPTNAIYGFLTMLGRVLKEHRPEYVAVCFDVSRKTFRQEKFAEYKKQRESMPDELSSQIPYIKQIVRAYNLALFEREGYEADDVIATLAAKAREKKIETVIVSSDKDILQIVDEGVKVFSPYKDEGILYDEAAVRTRFGVDPGRIPDVLALMGDASDNIPQVPGIGEKTAVALIQEYGSVENVLEKVQTVKQEKLRLSLGQSRDQIVLNKELVMLDRSVPVEFDLERLAVREPDNQELFRIFRQLELKKFLKDLSAQSAAAPACALPQIDQSRLASFLKAGLSGREIFVHESQSGSIDCSLDGDVFSFDPALPAARSLLSDPGIRKTGHDLKRLKVSLARRGIGFDGLFFDTMIAGYVLNPGLSSYRLPDLVWHYLAEPVHADIAGQQALETIARLKPALETKLRESSLEGLFSDLEMPLVSVLARMEITGVKIDVEILTALSKTVEKRLASTVGNIYALCGREFNINSPKQLSEILFVTLKLPVIKKTKTGASTDEEVLRELAGQHPLPALLLDYRQLSKLKSTYIDVLPGLADKESGRIHASFNQSGTETGRLSSSNPNLQNIPIKTDIGSTIRRAFVAGGAGQELVSCDYSQIELRILAHVTRDECLVEAFRSGRDIHRATAALIHGIDDETKVSDAMRETAKRVNFGIIYGLTSFGLSRDLKIAAPEAQAFIDAYFLRYPRVKEYIGEQIARAQKDGYVTTLLGRKRYLPEINNRNIAVRQFAQRQAVNTPLQGTAADMIKLAMLAIDREICSRRLRCSMILQIHDELVFDCPMQEAHEVLPVIRDTMEHVMPLDVPVRVDMKKGKNWLDMEPVTP